jgi:hypothetical protein
MKHCPRCGHAYTDDLLYCLADGTPLVADEEATVVRKVPPPPAPPTGVSPVFLYLFLGVLALFIISAAAGVAVWMLWPGPDVVPPRNDNGSGNIVAPTVTPTPAPSPSPSATPAPPANNNDDLERERRRLAEERRRLEEERRKASETPEPFNDPGTMRIKFRRGSIGESVSGTVGRRRSFVLRTLDGQYLSASVGSEGNCVTFSGGGTTTGYATRSADSYLHIQNNCDRPSRFSLSVTVR